MAKSLLKLHDDRAADNEIGVLLYSMVNWQTLQIRFMEDYLAAAGAPNPVAARSCPPAPPLSLPRPAGAGGSTAPAPTPAGVATSAASCRDNRDGLAAFWLALGVAALQLS